MHVLKAWGCTPYSPRRLRVQGYRQCRKNPCAAPYGRCGQCRASSTYKTVWADVMHGAGVEQQYGLAPVGVGCRLAAACVLSTPNRPESSPTRRALSPSRGAWGQRVALGLSTVVAVVGRQRFNHSMLLQSFLRHDGLVGIEHHAYYPVAPPRSSCVPRFCSRAAQLSFADEPFAV